MLYLEIESSDGRLVDCDIEEGRAEMRKAASIDFLIRCLFPEHSVPACGTLGSPPKPYLSASE